MGFMKHKLSMFMICSLENRRIAVVYILSSIVITTPGKAYY